MSSNPKDIPDFSASIKNCDDFSVDSYLHNEFLKVFSELQGKVSGLNLSTRDLKNDCIDFIQKYSDDEKIEEDEYGFNKERNKILSRVQYVEKSFNELMGKINGRYYDDIMDAYSFDGKKDYAFYSKIMITMSELIDMAKNQLDWAIKIRIKINEIYKNYFGEK